MPFNNFNDRHFTDTQKAAISKAIGQLENLLTPKLANLNAEERQKYGSVNENNKRVINKVYEYHINQPNLQSPDIDWAEFDRDYSSRLFIENTINQLQSLIIGANNAKIMHDWDNYREALIDYGYSQYKMGTSAPGYEQKVREIGQFFKRRPHSPNTNDTNSQEDNKPEEETNE